MGVQNEAVLFHRCAQLNQRARVQRLENRIDADPVTVLNRTGKVHRLAVNQNEIDFRVWHAHRLDPVLHGGGQFECVRERSKAPGERQEIVQPGVVAKHCALAWNSRH